MHKIIRERILKKFKYKCARCGSTENLQIDHIIPVTKGGREDEENMQVLCRTCNIKKGNRIDYSKYFQTGVDPEYILVSTELLEVMKAPSSEIHSAIMQMFSKNDRETKDARI